MNARSARLRLPVKRFAILCVSVIGLAACAEPAADRDLLAARGLIQEDAPVKAAAEIIIVAPAGKILGLLTDIGGWPRWQLDISKATNHVHPSVGSQFVWSTGGMDIHSTIQMLDSERAICWTGRMLHVHAIHCWALISLPDDRVLVKTRESMDGWLITRIYSSPELLESDKRWLARLKQAAEH